MGKRGEGKWAVHHGEELGKTAFGIMLTASDTRERNARHSVYHHFAFVRGTETDTSGSTNVEG